MGERETSGKKNKDEGIGEKERVMSSSGVEESM